jgi:hypothetical protein
VGKEPKWNKEGPSELKAWRRSGATDFSVAGNKMKRRRKRCEENM